MKFSFDFNVETFALLKQFLFLPQHSANVSDMIGEWYVVASTKNDCKCKVLNTDVTSNSTEYMTFDMTYDCVLSSFRVKSNENRRGVAFPSTGGLFLGGSSLPFGAVGTLGRGIVFDSREVANQTYIFVTTDCDKETSTFRVLAKDASKLPGKKNLQDLIDSVDSVKYLNTSNLILRTSDVWHQCNSSLPQGECGKYYGTCPEEDECCKGAGMGKGYFCDTCD